MYSIPHSRMKRLAQMAMDKLKGTNYKIASELLTTVKTLSRVFYEFKTHERIENECIMRRLQVCTLTPRVSILWRTEGCRIAWLKCSFDVKCVIKGLEELEVSFHRQSKDKFVLDDPEKKRSSLKFCFLTSGQVNQAQHRKYCRV